MRYEKISRITGLRKFLLKKFLSGSHKNDMGKFTVSQDLEKFCHFFCQGSPIAQRTILPSQWAHVCYFFNICTFLSLPFIFLYPLYLCPLAVNIVQVNGFHSYWVWENHASVMELRFAILAFLNSMRLILLSHFAKFLSGL